MKKYKEKFNKLSVRQKAELIIAVILTIAVIIVVPTLAWFTYQRKAAEMYKVKYPNSLYLSAAHREDSTCFEVTGIDADEILVDGNGDKILSNGKEQKITHKDYVFNVTGEAVDEFTIQLAYTTNNNFTYEVYAAKELTTIPSGNYTGIEVDYVPYKLKGNEAEDMPTLSGNQYHLDAAAGDWLYYQIDTSLNETESSGKYAGVYLNSTSGTSADNDASGTYYGMAYDDYNNTQADAKPVYWQATGVKAIPGTSNSNKETFSRHFILRVSWPAGSLDNTAKETDIIYISVLATQ